MNLSSKLSTRRGVLGALGKLAATAAAVLVAPARAFGAQVRGILPGGRPRNGHWWGMAIDLDLCTGCGACVVACRSENNVALTGHAPGSEGTGIYWMELMPRTEETGDGSTLPMEFLPTPCMHCENPPCVKVCPTNATYQNEDGIVAQIWDRCIGCRYCQVACPYSRRYFNWKEPEWPDSYKNLLNPDVATRCEGVVEKCTFCHHRIRHAREEARREERALTDADVKRLPACAQSCPAEAIVFGDLNDSESLVSHLSRSPRAFRLLEHVGTRPKVTYLAKDRREER